jgi:hypothetical protein
MSVTTPVVAVVASSPSSGCTAGDALPEDGGRPGTAGMLTPKAAQATGVGDADSATATTRPRRSPSIVD